MRTQRGLAVVVAMLAVALASVTAVAMIDAQLLRTRAYENALARAQTDSVAAAAAQWAAAILAEDDRLVDHLGETWAYRAPPFFAERGEVVGAISDEQARFNLNNVVRGGVSSPRDVLILQRLMTMVGVPVELADALVDWIDADSIPSGAAGAEDAYYQGREPPYAAANRRLADLGELARVRGFTPQVIAALAPYVTALPVETRVNVNTTSVLVLRAVVPSLGADEARNIVEARRSHVYRSREDFIRGLTTPPPSPVDADLDVRSRWFTAEATVRLDRVHSRYRILLDRPEVAGYPRIAAVKPQAY